MAAAVRSLGALCPRALSAVWSHCALRGVTAVSASCALCSDWRSSVRTLHLHPSLCAGHNKWSKVKNIKGPKDEARSRVFQKLSMMIRVSVKERGPDPELNLNLANLLEQCRSKNMPKASVEAAMKIGAKPVSQFIVEGRGPGGYLLLVETLTDNSSRTQQDIKKILNRNKGMVSDGARNNFEKRGVVVVPAKDITAERALELAIEAGAEDVQEMEDEEENTILKFICEVAEVKKVRSSLEKLGLQITSAGLEFVPRSTVFLDEDHLNDASNLMEALTDWPEVVGVWDNIQTQS